MARRISSPILIGREAELQAFDIALQEAAAGRPGLMVIGGEAGIGKSRLVQEFASRTQAARGLAVVGSAPPPAGTERIPLAALAQVLRSLIRSVDARSLDHLLGPARRDLAALLPELGRLDAEGMPHSFAAVRLAEAALVTVESVARRPGLLLLVLEDLQWSDDETRASLAYVSRNLVDAPVLIVLTHRIDQADDAGTLLDYLAELIRRGNVERLDLGPLPSADVAALLRAIMGADPEPSLARGIATRSGGSPFYVEELLLAGSESGRPPASVRVAVGARLARLSPLARALVHSLAVAGGPVHPDLLSAVTECRPEALGDGLAELRRASMVAQGPWPGRPGDEDAQLRHVLVREAVLETIAPSTQRELHGRFADAIDRVPDKGGPSDVERASALARHRLLAGDDLRALPALRAEARAAEQARSFEVAARAYALALEVLDRIPRERAGHPDTPEAARLRLELLERAAHVTSLVGRPKVAVTQARQALELAARGPSAADPELTPRLTMHLARFQAEAGQPGEALVTIESAVHSAPPDSLLLARALTVWARLLGRDGRHGEALERSEAAIRIAGRLGARTELDQARTVQASALWGLGRTHEARAVLDQTRAARRGRDSRSAPPSRPSRMVADVLVYMDRAEVLGQAGDLPGAVTAAQEGLRVARERGLASTQGALLSAMAARDLLRLGAWDDAERLLDQALADSPVPEPEVLLVRARLACLRGDWERVDSVLQGVDASRTPLAEIGWLAYRHLVQAEAAAWRRRTGEARAVVEEGIARSLAEPASDGHLQLAALGVRIEASARGGARRSAIDAETSQQIAAGYVIRLRAALETATEARDARGSAMLAEAAAELARLTSRPAVPAWQEAAATWEAARDPYQSAYCSLRLAEALVIEQAQREAAREALLAVMATVDRLGAGPLGQEAESLARRARLIAVPPPAPAGAGAATTLESRTRQLGLSERETEVLGLLAEGLTDREIGERLFITTKTAGHHVSHILDKLALDRRGEAAAFAFRMGLIDRPA